MMKEGELENGMEDVSSCGQVRRGREDRRQQRMQKKEVRTKPLSTRCLGDLHGQEVLT